MIRDYRKIVGDKSIITSFDCSSDYKLSNCLNSVIRLLSD